MTFFKSKPARSKKLRESARGESCTLMIPGVCDHGTETTVLCHLHDQVSGMGTKASDLAAVYGCRGCHSVMDGAVRPPEWVTPATVASCVLDALIRTHQRMFEKGLIQVKGAKA